MSATLTKMMTQMMILKTMMMKREDYLKKNLKLHL
jgi:hypothetical protein